MRQEHPAGEVAPAGEFAGGAEESRFERNEQRGEKDRESASDSDNADAAAIEALKQSHGSRRQQGHIQDVRAERSESAVAEQNGLQRQDEGHRPRPQARPKHPRQQHSADQMGADSRQHRHVEQLGGDDESAKSGGEPQKKGRRTGMARKRTGSSKQRKS